jgi:hypothetical protein
VSDSPPWIHVCRHPSPHTIPAALLHSLDPPRRPTHHFTDHVKRSSFGRSRRDPPSIPAPRSLRRAAYPPADPAPGP